MQYRADIDGLRALAVASVVIYHADHRWLPGGFTGVDVFFVISGYLITRMIAAEPALRVVHVYPKLCGEGRCAIARDGRALYHDDDHLSVEGARQLRLALAPALEPPTQR